MCNVVKSNERVDPPYQIANIGQTVKFTCYSGEIVTWTFEGGPLPLNTQNSLIFETQSNILKIERVHLGNAGTYACIEDEDMIIVEGEGELSVRGW